MKFIIKKICFFLLIISLKISHAQEITPYIKEVTLIFERISNRQLKSPIYLKNNSLGLPITLSNYNSYVNEMNSRNMNTIFIPSITFNLNSDDCLELNNMIIHDTSSSELEISYFPKYKAQVFKDSLQNKFFLGGLKFVKPILFRKNTRCFMVNFTSSSLDAYFLKKVNNKWFFDRFYYRYQDD